MANLRILLWAPFGAGEHYWGPGISAYRLYSQGLPPGVELHLAHGFSKQLDYPLFKGIYKIGNLESNKLSQIVFLLKSYLWIRKNAHQFDVVHCLGIYETSFRPGVWFESFGVRAFCKITGDTGGLVKNSRFSKLLGIAKRRKRKLNTLTGYIAISDEIVRTLSSLGVKDQLIFKIPNGVDNQRFKPVEESQKKILKENFGLLNKFTVLFVGGLSARKRPMWLLQAFHNVLQKEGELMQLVFLGPDRSGGEELHQILSYVRKHSLESSVYHFEHSEQPEKFYQLADLYCLPSKSEGMSNALLEAMACGLPSIVTEISGSKDLIKEGFNGSFVNDILGLAGEIERYLKNKDITKIFGRNATLLIQNNFNADLILERHLELFEKATDDV